MVNVIIKNISIDTSKTNNSNYLYKDGIVDINPYSNLSNVVYERGDGTVPQSSSVIENISKTSSGVTSLDEKDTTKHSLLIRFFKDELVDFIIN